VHNSGKIYLQHHHWYYKYTYIHTHEIPFSWIAVYLWWRYLKFLLSILKLFVLADIKGSASSQQSTFIFNWHWHNKLSYC
jgi:hypothetical protein